MLCGIGQIIVDGGVMGRAHLWWFLLGIEQVTTVPGYSWCQIFTHQNNMIIECLYFLLYIFLSNKSGRNQLEYETYVYDFSLYFCSWFIVQHIDFYWEYCLVRKWVMSQRLISFIYHSSYAWTLVIYWYYKNCR